MSYILLVEDNLNNAEMMIRLLEAENFEVRHSIKGLDAAHIARKERPLLILMDFNLPDIDGRTLILQLRKQLGGDAAPPIVAVTARTGNVEKQIAERFGCSAFISKPFEPEEFLKTVKGLVPTLSK